MTVCDLHSSGITFIHFSSMTEKKRIRGCLEGICTHLSSVRLIKILPSVENTMKDIRNCGLWQGKEKCKLCQITSPSFYTLSHSHLSTQLWFFVTLWIYVLDVQQIGRFQSSDSAHSQTWKRKETSVIVTAVHLNIQDLISILQFECCQKTIVKRLWRDSNDIYKSYTPFLLHQDAKWIQKIELLQLYLYSLFMSLSSKVSSLSSSFPCDSLYNHLMLRCFMSFCIFIVILFVFIAFCAIIWCLFWAPLCSWNCSCIYSMSLLFN